MTTIGVFAAIFDAQGRILCVKRNYGPRNWTNPGGRLEPNESPLDGLVREVREETGYIIQPGRLIGVYSVTSKDDLVLSIEATITGREAWAPDGEIEQCGFFALDALPEPMKIPTRTRIQDAFERRAGVIRVWESSEWASAPGPVNGPG